MTERRFFVAPVDVAASELILRGDEAHHARRVLRLRAGDVLTCFDGLGHAWEGRLERFDGDNAVVAIVSTVLPEPVDGLRITLAAAVVKGERMDVIVQKSTELGVHRIVPVLADRCDVRLDATSASKRMSRWRRVALEAAKQCERQTLPILENPRVLDATLLAESPSNVVLVERGARPVRESLEALGGVDAVTIFVGPEGGWTDSERDLFEQSGATCVSLGHRILRAETAAIAGLAIVRYSLDYQTTKRSPGESETQRSGSD